MTYRDSALKLDRLLGPLVAATDAVARLDERINSSPVRAGFLERMHFIDSVSALWVEGELVQLEDLVLHDVEMDVRAPTHALTRAHEILRMRRRLSGSEPDWAFGPGGLALFNLGPAPADASARIAAPEAKSAAVDEIEAFDAELASIDQLLARTTATLEGATAEIDRQQRNRDRDRLVYDDDWDEERRFAEWQLGLDENAEQPPLLRAALALESWTTLDVLQHGSWIGTLLSAAILRQTGTTSRHLLPVHAGMRAISRERRSATARTRRLIACLDAFREGAEAAMKQHDKLMAARSVMERRTIGRRSNSRLPQLLDLVMEKPIVSAGMIAKALGVTHQGAVALAGDLHLREVTGRGRFRAWGVL